MVVVLVYLVLNLYSCPILSDYMGNIIGSCAGGMTGMCCVSLLSRDCGNFEDSPSSITNCLDTLLVLTPLMVAVTVMNYSSVSAELFLLFLIFWNLVANVVIAGNVCLAKEYYGIRFASPIISAAACTAVTYWGIYITDMAVVKSGDSVIALSSLIGISFLTGLVLSDIGFRLNLGIREWLVRLEDRTVLKIFVQVILITWSLAALWTALDLVNIYFLIPVVTIVALSVVDLNDNGERGTIVSASFVIAGIAMIAHNALPFPVTLVVLAVYNNCFLSLL